MFSHSVTGGGRCDITNPPITWVRHHHPRPHLGQTSPPPPHLSQTSPPLQPTWVRHHPYLDQTSPPPPGSDTTTLLALTANSASQSSAQTHIHSAIVVIDTSNNAWHSQVHWLVGTSHLAVKASNAPAPKPGSDIPTPCPPGQTSPPPPPPRHTGTTVYVQAFGTHPTGMQSCLQLCEFLHTLFTPNP